MVLRTIVLAIAIATVECINRAKFVQIPEPQKNFQVEEYMGDWYLTYRLTSCSWAGSSDFTNFVSRHSLQPDRSIILKDTWRSSVCTSATLNLVTNKREGAYLLKDPIGNVISGDHIVMATDYKKFAIIYGCTKTDISGVCADPYIVVKTRKTDPSASTLKMIKAIPDHYFELGLNEMIKIQHDDPCVKLTPKYDYYAPSMDYLKKKY